MVSLHRRELRLDHDTALGTSRPCRAARLRLKAHSRSSVFCPCVHPYYSGFARVFLECLFRRYLKFRSDERLDPILASQSQAQKTASTFQIDVKIKKGAALAFGGDPSG